MGIHECPMVHAPLELRVDMRRSEVDAIRRKLKQVFVAELRVTAENKFGNDQKRRGASP